MLTRMTEKDWTFALEVFDAAQSSRGEPGRDDRKFLEAILYFMVHNVSWRALPAEFGNWNSVWKRFLAAQPHGGVRDLLPTARRAKSYRAFGAVLRQHRGTRSWGRPPGQKRLSCLSSVVSPFDDPAWTASP